MALIPGTYLGPYEIVGQIGAGGMGEVYRARDSKLNRDVALKVIAAAFALEPERLARFRREAQVLAALNHPHIGGIYGFEDSGETHALVLELVEGDTLADRIARAPVPVDEAVPIARQIADALAAAHEQGITHRDLKPANIKITRDGVVKVLDFGLAKLNAPTVQDAPNNRSLSPTITSPAMMTGVGMLLGTAAYMSPEQAKGREADKRSDIWAFGCVLYEMLIGRRAFDGEDLTDVLGAVVRLEPNWAALPPDVPPSIRTLVQQCLIKDRPARIGDIAAAIFVLDHHTGLSSAGITSVASVPAAPRWRPLVWVAAIVVISTLAAAGVWWRMRSAAPAMVITTIATSGSTALSLSGSERDIAITPDGRRIVYRGSNQLLVRTLNQLEPTVLSGLGAPRGIFISPDGHWVGFFDGTAIKKVAITGGAPVTITPVPGLAGSRGATWGPDGTIIFASNTLGTGLQRVSAAGGDSTVLTKPDRERGEGYHLWPRLLPGGGKVLFTITPVGGNTSNAQIAVLDLHTGTSKVLIRGGSDAQYVPTGHLVYGVNGTLRAVAFDLGRLEVVGTPAPVLEGVVTTLTGAADAAVAANGSLAYVPGVGGFGGQPQSVVSVDRQGRASPLSSLPLDSYRDVRVSPDGTRLALATQDDVWIYDRARATLSRLTTDTASDTRPLWTPDSQRIVFTSNRAGYRELFWRPADGTGSEDRLLARAKDLIDLRADGWSADGKHLLFTEVSPTFQGAIGQIAIERPSDAKMLVKSEFYNDFPGVSPDGRWMAYESNVSGQYEIYVERYPELGHRQPISTGGGRLPLWSRDGRELFFSSLDNRQMLTVRVQSGTTLVAGQSRVLFEFAMAAPAGGSRTYDIASDGRFLIIRGGQAETGGRPAMPIVFVQNWFEELRRLVPTN